MAFDLNALATRSAKTNVDFMGQSAVVTYNPSLLTQASYDKAKNGDDADFAAFFCDLVDDWDVKRGNKKVPLTPAGIQTVPLVFIKAVYNKIMSADPEVAEQGKASNDG